MNDFYVYAHVRLDTDQIFYVGKGRRNRCRRKERNKHWKHIVEKTGYRIIFLEEKLSEKEAFESEVYWIKRLKEKGLCQANYSDGGEGCSGYKWTEEQRLRHSKKLRSLSENIKKGQLARIQKIKGRTKETHQGIKKISEQLKGTGNGRAIWDVLTPDGKFDTILEVAIFYNISTAAVHRRLNSNSNRFKDWTKIKKENK